MNENVSTYLKSRTVGEPLYANSGDIITTCNITLDDGSVKTGKSIRDISGFDSEEARNAAYNDAMAELVPGVSLIVNRAISL